MEWYYKKRNPHYRVLPPFAPGCDEANEEAMEMIYPRETRQIYIPRGLGGKLNRVVGEVVHRNPEAIIHWHLDDLYLGQTSLIHQMEFMAAEGWHTLTLVDSQGLMLEKTFEVVEN